MDTVALYIGYGALLGLAAIVLSVLMVLLVEVVVMVSRGIRRRMAE